MAGNVYTQTGLGYNLYNKTGGGGGLDARNQQAAANDPNNTAANTGYWWSNLPQGMGQTYDQLVQRYLGNAGYFANMPSAAYAQNQAGGQTLLPFYNAAPRASNLAFANLMQGLQNQGQADPRILNNLLGQIGQQTQGQQQQLAGGLAARGLQNSGVGMALQQAVGNAGAQQATNARVADMQGAQQRNLQLMQLFNQLVQQPGTDYMALASQQYNQNANRQQQQQAANQAFWAGLLNTVGSFF